VNNEQSCLESSTAWFGLSEERLVTVQSTFIVTAVVVEISARRQIEALVRASEPAQSFDSGRCVTAAQAGVRVHRLTQIRSHHGDQQ